MSEKSTGGASIIGLLVKEFPDKAMGYMRMLDQHGIYGSDIYKAYYSLCDGDCLKFLSKLTDGSLVKELKGA